MENDLSWDDLRTLLFVHRHQSLLAASRALGTSTSTIARRLESLERATGKTLVRRTPEGTVLERAAVRLVEIAETTERQLAAERRLGAADEVSGVVRVATGQGPARLLTRVFAALQRTHPGLVVELSVTETAVDLGRREADIGLRTVKTASSTVIERRLGDVEFSLFASQHYLERRLGAARVDDLSTLDFVSQEATRMPQRQWLHAAGARRFVFLANDEGSIIEASRQGMGIGLFAGIQVADEQGLLRLECARPPLRLPVFLAYHRDLRRERRVVAVLQAMQRALAPWAS